MKPTPHTPIDRARYLLSVGLVSLVTASVAYGQPTDADSLRRLQEENAALRKRLAELEGGQAKPAPAPTRTQAPASTPAPTVPVVETNSVRDDGTVTLSPFVVKSDKDYGYLKTNSATATRIDAPIQQIPLAISVVSNEFVQDAGMRDISDILRYVGSSAGDPKMGLRQPGNSATPSGTMTLRGFPISQRLRNGVFRYTGYNLDNIDRVEIIKGPAAIFYGVGYPGGVINYVTKKPVFTKLPTTITYGYGGEGDHVGDQRMTMDHNTVLNENTAFRIVGAWNNMGGDKNFEYNKGFSITPSVKFKPFKNERLVITAEFEHVNMRRNQDDSSWTYDEQYFLDYKNPSASLLTAAGITPTDPAALSKWQTLMNANYGRTYGTWINYKRIETGNRFYPTYQKAARGAFYTDTSGNRVHDKEFNYYGQGAYTSQLVDTLEVTVDASLTDWIDARYTMTNSDARFESLSNSATPAANGYEFFAAGPSQRGDYRKTMNHQLDVVAKKKLFGIEHKVLFGGLLSISDQKYTGFGPYLWLNIPGAAEYNPNLPANGTTNIPPWLNNYSWGLAFQTLTDRNGNKLNAFDLFARYDPAIHPSPDVSRITRPDRSIVDAGKPKSEEQYINYQADLLDNRLHLMGGYRWTKQDSNGGQRASSNPPWINGAANLFEVIDPSEWDAYGIGVNSGFNPWVRNADGSYQPAKPLPTTQQLGSYYQGTFSVNKGESYMVGAAFDLRPDVTLYVSRSQSFRPTSGSGGIYTVDGLRARAQLLGLDPDKELARIRAEGVDTIFGNEKGLNTEFGVKTSLWNNKLVTTVSVFQLDRTGEVLDDTPRQQAEILNYSGPNKTGVYSTGNYINPVTGQTTSGVRWYSNGTKRRVEGAEFEAIWTPLRNFQMVASGSWLWKAKTLLNTALDPTATTNAAADARYYNYEFRMPGVSEYRFNMFSKYTFSNGGPIGGLAVALGARYASEINIANTNEYDSKRGGLTAGDYVVFDGNLSYPWELGGYRITTNLNVTNLTNKDYSEGGGGFGNAASGVGFSFSPPRAWMLTNTISF